MPAGACQLFEQFGDKLRRTLVRHRPLVQPPEYIARRAACQRLILPSENILTYIKLEPRPPLSHSNERDLGLVLKEKTGPAQHALWDQEESIEIESLQTAGLSRRRRAGRALGSMHRILTSEETPRWQHGPIKPFWLLY